MFAARITISECRGGEAVFPASLFAPGVAELARGRVTALLGPSGIGKSTLLRVLAGLQSTSGWADVAFGEGTHRAALMAQDVGLLPWLTVAQNVALGGHLRGETVDNLHVLDLLSKVGLANCAADLPATLSGGMRQRAALARTLYENADIWLLDEPFTALDAITRRRMQQLTLAHAGDKAVLLVTHDPDEAMAMADEILLLEGHPAAIVPFEKTTDSAALWERILGRADLTGQAMAS